MIEEEAIRVVEGPPFLTTAKQLSNDMTDLAQVLPKSLPSYEEDAKLILPAPRIERHHAKSIPPSETRSQPARAAKNKPKSSVLSKSLHPTKSAHGKPQHSKNPHPPKKPIDLIKPDDDDDSGGKKDSAKDKKDKKRSRGGAHEFLDLLPQEKKKSLLNSIEKSRNKYQQKEIDNLREFQLETNDILKEFVS